MILYLRVCPCPGADADGWKYTHPMGQARLAPHPSDVHKQQTTSGFALTVKDLLLSGTPEPVSAVTGFDGAGGDGSRRIHTGQTPPRVCPVCDFVHVTHVYFTESEWVSVEGLFRSANEMFVYSKGC